MKVKYVMYDIENVLASREYAATAFALIPRKNEDVVIDDKRYSVTRVANRLGKNPQHDVVYIFLTKD